MWNALFGGYYAEMVRLHLGVLDDWDKPWAGHSYDHCSLVLVVN